MVYILNSPVSEAGGCVSCSWMSSDSLVCPDVFRIDISGLYPTTPNTAVTFAGRTKVGGGCGGSDQYITFTFDSPSVGDIFIDIDVWGAYRDGVWSSSTTILLHIDSPLGPFSSGTAVKMYPQSYGTQTDVPVSVTFGSGGCPLNTSATITLLDDGTYTA